MSDEEKRWPFDGFYLKLAEAQREYEQEQHIDPASLTEEERQQKLQELRDCTESGYAYDVHMPTAAMSSE